MCTGHGDLCGVSQGFCRGGLAAFGDSHPTLIWAMHTFGPSFFTQGQIEGVGVAEFVGTDAVALCEVAPLSCSSEYGVVGAVG